MINNKYLLAVLVLLMGAVTVPSLVHAEGDLLASPTPQPTERITAPEISGLNPDVVMSEGNQGETHPSGIFSPPGIQLPVPVAPPVYIQLEPQKIKIPGSAVQSLGVPLRIQDPDQVTCGLQALGMVMDFLELGSGTDAPTDQQLLSFISRQGLLYEWGTGVEELAYSAREFGYAGSYAFHGWTLHQLIDHIQRGIPVVVSLGIDGPEKPGHFVTITGFSDNGRWVTYNDPLGGRKTVPIDKFLDQWETQGKAGVIVEKKSLPAGMDPMLSWVGFFSALSMLTLLVGRTGSIETWLALKELRKKISNPRRRGIGAGPPPPADLKPELIKVPRYETKTVYRGLKTVELEVPVYETIQVKVGFRGVKKKVPVYENRRIQVGFETVTKKIPEYSTKRIKVGTKTVREKIPVTRYITKRVQEWKKFTKKIPVYRTIGSRRRQVGTRTQTRWKKSPVIKRVAYQTTKTITRQVPKYKEVKVVIGYRTVKEKVPKYENKKVLAGHKTVTETKPVYEERRVRVGSKTVTRRVPDYQTVRVVVGYDEIPKLEKNLPRKDEDGKDDPELTDQEIRLFKKLTESSDPIPPPPTGFSKPVWDSLSSEAQQKILTKNTNKKKSTEAIVEEQDSLILNALKGINEKVIEPVKRTLKNPEEILKLINPSKLPKMMSLSARETWDINLFTQEGMVARTYLPPNFWQLFYMEQKLNIEQKAVLTLNPGSLINYDITTAKGSVKFNEDISYIFGPGEMGFSIKGQDDKAGYDYTVTKHSIQITWRGLTYKYKEEGVVVQEPIDGVHVKFVNTLKCDTKIIKFEGILVLVLITCLVFELGPALIDVLLPSGVIGALSGIK